MRRSGSRSQWGASRRSTPRSLSERGRLVERTAFAGDDDHQPCAPRLGMAEEAAQRLMRLGLVHTMQVERAVDRPAAARELALQPPFERRERQGAGLAGFASAAAGASAGGGAGGPRRERLRGRGQARAAAPRDERATSVQSAISSSLSRLRRCGRRRLLHGSSPTGRSTANAPAMADRPGARARRVAAAEEYVGAGRSRQSPSPCPARS